MIKIILLSDFEEGYGKDLLRGIAQYSKDHGPWTFCRMPNAYSEKLGRKGILKWAQEWEANGIIGRFHDDDDVKLFTDANIPVIAQDFKERLHTVPNLTSSYIDTGARGADYFLKKGFTNFAFYGFKDIVWSRERAMGFEQQIGQAGYSVHHFEPKDAKSQDLWYYKPSELTNWLKSIPKPLALMACDDNQGYHVTEAARHAGLRIPDEVSILGVDNDEMICELSDPPLSSIELDTRKGGYEAARLMDQMIHSKKAQQWNDIVVNSTQVVTRLSTDVFASKDAYIVTALKFIHQNLDKNLRVEQILREVPLSRRSLEKRFVQTTGYPVYEYIYKQRIEKFTKKLLETEMSIFEIAIDLGLSDSKNIARQFKQIKGVTPMEYRKKFLIAKQR